MKLTNEIIVEAVKLLKMGNYVVTICDYLCIEEATWYNWIKNGKQAKQKEENGSKISENEEMYLKFLKSIKKAQSESVVRNVGIIQQAATNTWQASAWILERTKPDLYGQKQQVVISDSQDTLDIESVRAKLAELKSKGKEPKE